MDVKKVNIAIDFGTTNTLVATFEDKPNILRLPGISYELCGIDLIPSAVGYSNDKGRTQISIGKETGKLPECTIVRRMKRLATTRRYKQILGNEVSYRQATKDFLEHLINALRYRFLQSEIGTIVFTVPVDSYDTYRAIIDEVCEKTRVYSYHVVDESTAAALGYEIPFSNDSPYMIIDFGGGTIDVSVVRLTRRGTSTAVNVLGKSGADFGGTDIDEWILADFITNQGLKDSLSKYSENEALRNSIERMKIDLCNRGAGKITFNDEAGDFTIKAQYTNTQFNDILNKNRFQVMIQSTIDNALDNAYENGVKKRDIAQVLVVGGSSQIPLFLDIIKTNFPHRVKEQDPYGAVVRGAANYLNGRIIEDFLHHHYALQYLDKKRNLYDYEVIVPEGTKYPANNIKRLIVTLPFSGQTKAELKIFEVGKYMNEDSELSGVYYGKDGKLMTQREGVNVETSRVPLNENAADFIHIDPPSVKDEDRFEVLFSVDSERMLRVSVRDLKVNSWLMQDRIVARLK